MSEMSDYYTVEIKQGYNTVNLTFKGVFRAVNFASIVLSTGDDDVEVRIRKQVEEEDEE